jgi:ArsR family transcriptional regulator, cadmium/lead-responsive transcriptional repressor
MTTKVDDELWSAIADPSRRRVLDLLVSNGDASASWLAGHVAFSRQAVSKHLVVLEEAGLVSRRKQGREVLYQVEADRLDQATKAMADVTARWDRRLAAIKRLAEEATQWNRGKESSGTDRSAWREAVHSVAKGSLGEGEHLLRPYRVSEDGEPGGVVEAAVAELVGPSTVPTRSK